MPWRLTTQQQPDVGRDCHKISIGCFVIASLCLVLLSTQHQGRWNNHHITLTAIKEQPTIETVHWIVLILEITGSISKTSKQKRSRKDIAPIFLNIGAGWSHVPASIHQGVDFCPKFGVKAWNRKVWIWWIGGLPHAHHNHFQIKRSKACERPSHTASVWLLRQ